MNTHRLSGGHSAGRPSPSPGSRWAAATSAGWLGPGAIRPGTERGPGAAADGRGLAVRHQLVRHRRRLRRRRSELAIQNGFSLLARDGERDVLPLCAERAVAYLAL